MSDIKCPFCQQELQKDSDGYYTCYTDNCECMKYGGNGASGSESLWLALINTKKFLDIESSEHDLCHDALVGRTKELDSTQKALEQSEICCTEWEKQALDYKAENIALSIKSEFVADVLKEIDKLLSSNKFDVNECSLLNITQTKISMLLKFLRENIL